MRQRHFPIHDILLAALRGETIPDGQYRDLAWCRYIMSHYYRPRCKNLEEVGAKVGKHHSSVSYYLKKYEDEYKYNPTFRVYAEWFKTQANGKV